MTARALMTTPRRITETHSHDCQKRLNFVASFAAILLPQTNSAPNPLKDRNVFFDKPSGM
jgi:hypothetical protein